MQTTMTLGEIRSYDPGPEVWEKLVSACGTSDDKHVVDLRDILRSNGPKDASWTTRSLPRRERVALALIASRTVEHLSTAAQVCNDVTARWIAGEAIDKDLAVAASAALAAAWETEFDAAWERLGNLLKQWCDEQD